MNKKNINRILIILAGIIAVALFKYFDLGQYLTLDYLKESQARFTAIYEAHRLAVIGAYLAIYIVVTALSLPGAVIMTLAGGGLFGFWIGTLVVSFASSIMSCMVGPSGTASAVSYHAMFCSAQKYGP